MQAPHQHVARADLVMCRHDQVRQLRRQRDRTGRLVPNLQRPQFLRDTVRPQRLQNIELRAARRFRPPVGKVDDLALLDPIDRSVRLFDEASDVFRKSMIAARLLALAVHPLLNHDPPAVIGNDKAVQINIEAVLHGGAVYLGDEPARLCQR